MMSEVDATGGFVQTSKRTWKGVIRTKDEERIIWTCSHVHSRPEYNARYPDQRHNNGLVWEYSALNCGRGAVEEYRKGEPLASIVGLIGLVGSSSLAYIDRPDKKSALVHDLPGVFQGGKVIGSIRLVESGKRELTVSLANSQGVRAVYNPDSKTIDTPFSSTEGSHYRPEYLLLTNGIWGLMGTIWGLMFQDYRFTVEIKPTLEAPRLIGVAKDEKVLVGMSAVAVPRTKKITYNPKTKQYDVVDSSGTVIGSYYHRGEAREALDALKGKA